MIQQECHFSLTQQLQLTPKLQQAIRMLQLSTQELSQELTQALESNVMLELDPPLDTLSTPLSQLSSTDLHHDSAVDHDSAELAYDAFCDYPEKSRSEENSAGQLWPQVERETLQTHLLWQLRASQLTETNYNIGKIIIGLINDDGYLTENLKDIQSLLKTQGIVVSMKQISNVLSTIHGFEPLGVGAIDLQQTLLLQLNDYPTQTADVELAKHCIQHHLTLLATHQYRKLAQLCKIQSQVLDRALTLIQSLNPRPGNRYSNTSAANYISPDILVIKKGSAWHVKLNPLLLPKLRLNGCYLSLLDTQASNGTHHFIHTQLREARWLIQCLKQRNETLLKVAKAIIQHQQAFMTHGPGAMNALILKDIATELNLHQSTISRVSTKKYIQTPQGTFELKHFFNSHINTTYGEPCSAIAIQCFIKTLIANENPRKPFSDHKLTQHLALKGLTVARRTVSKYRESLRIPKATLRKH